MGLVGEIFPFDIDRFLNPLYGLDRLQPVDHQADDFIRYEHIRCCDETRFYKPFCTEPGKQGAGMVQVFAFHQTMGFEGGWFHTSPVI